eukprot:m.90929 g.90929  ORF g.90929 m.90929 type:complete len:513 (+) comp9884_c0_seq2:64-1602(+)
MHAAPKSAAGAGPGQSYPRNMKPRGMMLLPGKGGGFSQAPASMRTGYAAPSSNGSVYGYGPNNPAFQQANAIYAGLPTGRPVHAAAAPVSRRSKAVPGAPNIFNFVDPEASLAPWYLVGKPRKEVKKLATQVLRRGTVGEFFVRDISSHPGCLGLSIKTSRDDLMNYLLHAEGNGMGISVRGTKEVFPTLSRLIAHYATKRRPSLPVQLVNPASLGNGAKSKTPSPRSRTSHGPSTHYYPPPSRIHGEEEEEEEPEGFGDDFDESNDAPPTAPPATGGARRSRTQTSTVEDDKVTASRVAAAIDSSVKDAVESKVDELTREQIDNIEHRIAKRRAMIEKRRLALLQERQAESKRTLQNLNGGGAGGGRSSYAGSLASASMPRRADGGAYGSMASLEALERHRGGSQAAGPTSSSARHRAPLPDPKSIIGDPVAMWDAIVQSDATDSIKLNAAKKQLLYIQHEERLVKQKLAEAERALLRPRNFSENDTVFDDDFENGTIIDESGEVFGFGEL